MQITQFAHQSLRGRNPLQQSVPRQSLGTDFAVLLPATTGSSGIDIAGSICTHAYPSCRAGPKGSNLACLWQEFLPKEPDPQMGLAWRITWGEFRLSTSSSIATGSAGSWGMALPLEAKRIISWALAHRFLDRSCPCLLPEY
jgi:hypothetical protein